MTLVRIADLLASSPVDPAAHLDPDRVRRVTLVRRNSLDSPCGDRRPKR